MAWNSIILLLFLSPWLGQSDSNLDMNTEFVQKLNGFRIQGCPCGSPVPPVDFNPLLEKSAKRYAREIKRNNRFKHTDRKGKTVGSRVDAAGYRWLEVGENLGKGQVNLDQLIQDWLKSPTHCALMMSPKFKEVGLGRYQNIWVLHMGSR